MLRAVGVGLVAFIVAAQLTSPPASAAAAPTGALPVKPLRSAPLAPPSLDVPTGDFTHPAPDAGPGLHALERSPRSGFDPARSQVVSRAATSTTWRNPDGTETAELHSTAVNWLDPATGAWAAIDDALKPVAAGFHNGSGPLSVSVGPLTGPGPVVSVAGDGWSAAFGLEGATPGRPGVPAGGDVAFADAAGGVDLRYQVRDTRLKEQIVLKTPAAAGTRLRFPLTLEGVEPRAQADGSIGLFRPSGEEAAVLPPAWMVDSAPDASPGVTKPGDVAMHLAGGPGAWVVEVVPDAAWLADPARTFPVVIDPSIDAGHGNFQMDAFGSSPDPATNYNGWRQYWDGHYVDFAGYDNYAGNSQQYSYQYIDLVPVFGKQILSAMWRDFAFSTRGNGYFRMWPVADLWNESTVTWNNLPAHRTDTYKEGYSPANNWAYVDMTDWVTTWAAQAWPSRGISIDSAGQPSGVRFAASEEGATYNEAIFVTYNTPPTLADVAGPPGGSTVMTTTPTLSASGGSDDDGDQLSYLFRVSDTSDPEVGRVIDSGWQSTPSWPVPAGSLEDGVTYSWKVATWDGHLGGWSWATTFKVNLRLGDQGASPYDSVGGLRVNLANGNLSVAGASPTFPTVGGPVGVSYAYNSQAPAPSGLKGEYFNNCNGGTAFPPGEPSLVRRDPSVSFNWGSGSPAPGIIDADNFCARWSGYVTMPRTNTYCFQAVRDDGVVIKINDTTVVSSWGDQSTNPAPFGSTSTECIPLQADRTNRIEVDYFEHTGSAAAELWAKGPNVGPLPVPSSWLSTTPAGLPAGWSLSAGAADLAYAKAKLAGDSLVLVEPTGATHEYRRTATDGVGTTWAPTGDDDATVTTATENGQATYVVHDPDGLLYTFNAKGQLLRAVSASDDTNPAAAVYDYSGDSGRVAKITDPVSARSITLTYSQPNGTNVCPSPASGFYEAPSGMLCQIAYWDNTVTSLYYNNAGQMVEIVDPGGAITDFAYDGSGKMAVMRSPLAHDAIAAAQRADDGGAWTEIVYDGAGKVASVSLPAPVPGAAHPLHTYSYASSSQTDVHVAGAPEPNGYARRVGFNAAGQVSSDTDAAGATTQTSWDNGDRLVATVDPTNYKTTTIYDQAQRPTDTYGPVRADWIDPGTNRPYPANATATPHTATAYDEGIGGLAATYWANATLSGAPAAHATGVGDPTGALNANWDQAPPAGLPATNWSARFTGEIAFPASGTYNFRFFTDDGVRLFIDDQLLPLNAWVDQRASTATVAYAATAGRHRIRVDYYQHLGGAALTMYWTPPGGAETIVPGGDLFPRYGLATSTTDADGKKTATAYAVPERRLATATVADPGGLNLRTETDYNDAWLRPTARRLPKGAATQVAYAYYGGTEMRANPCSSEPAVSQAGRLRTRTAADPDGQGGPLAPIVTESVYDQAGRVVASRVQSDPTWNCMTYDGRGRLTSRTDRTGKTAATAYNGVVATTTFVDSSGATRTTTAEVDLLGRTWRYVDEQGTTTRSVFDQAGRLTDTYRTFTAQPETHLASMTYDPAGRVATLTEYASGSGRTSSYSYDAAGRLRTITRPNGVVTTNAYDPDRAFLASVANQRGGADLSSTSSFTYTDSLADRVATEASTGRTRSFTYDAAGRLTRTVEGSTTRNYAYDADTNRCSMATSCDGSYVYDNADRLTASPDASSYTYDTHGNLTSAALRATASTNPISDTFAFDAATPTHTTAVTVGGSGTLQSSLDWTSTAPVTTTATPNGTLNAGQSTTATMAVDSETRAAGSLTWQKGSHPVTASSTMAVPAAGSATTTIAPDATGTIAADLSWAPTTASKTFTGTVAAYPATNSHTITATANGTIDFTLSWSASLVGGDLGLKIWDGTTLCAQDVPLLGGTAHATCAVSGLGSYPSSHAYRLEVVNWNSSSMNYTLTGTYPATPTLDFELDNASGTRLASSTVVGGQPHRTLSYANAPAGTYKLKATSSDLAANPTLTETHQAQAYADVSLTLKDPSGATVSTVRNASGSASLPAATLTTSGGYTWAITNNSADVAAPWQLNWSTTTLGDDVSTGTVAASGTANRTVTADGGGYAAGSLTWQKGSHPVTASSTMAVPAAGSATTTIAPDATGTIAADLSWAPTTASKTFTGTVAAYPATNSHTITATANGTIDFTLTWNASLVGGDLALKIWDGTTLCAQDVPLLGGTAHATCAVSGLGTYPSSHSYRLEVVNWDSSSMNYTLTGTYPATPTLDFELDNASGTRIASSTIVSAQPHRTLTYGGAPAGTYKLKATSSDLAANPSLTETHQAQAYADVSLTLKDPSGATVSTVRNASGSASLPATTLAGAGTYTATITDNSADLSVPSYNLTLTTPRQRAASLSYQLKNGSGSVVASGTAAKPSTLSAPVTPGAYTLVTTRTSGAGSATITGTDPGSAPQEIIGYDGNDHATSINDGARTVAETLDPSGRVLRRVVTTNATGAITEDTVFGYDGSGDSPAYSRPSSAGAVTTYIGGPGGLLVTDTGGTASYPIANRHGDVVGTTDGAGAYTANSPADEFGKGLVPSTRLGWLGSHERFSTGGNLGLVRMGVRLYDPSLGRFLQVDPVEGGTDNDYAYPHDPINDFDLSGQIGFKKWWHDHGRQVRLGVAVVGIVASLVSLSLLAAPLFIAPMALGVIPEWVGTAAFVTGLSTASASTAFRCGRRVDNGCAISAAATAGSFVTAGASRLFPNLSQEAAIGLRAISQMYAAVRTAVGIDRRYR
ncbi:MAG TPA: PA14 domain-containing protein [Acidimicrobiales bacterium]|nr:PA14 domain-containing protein [Acidimicrobiales bacterium]